MSASLQNLVQKYGPLECLVIALSVVFLLARFWRLGTTPPGLHSDEMSYLANSVCLRHTGKDVWGHGWGLISGGPVNAYGYSVGFPLHYNVLYAAWLFIAGDSIAAARSYEVLISLVIVACTVGIAHNFLGRRAAVWALALSAVSPWTWALSRVAFIHPEFYTMHMFIGLWLLTRHVRRGDDPTTKELVIAGLLFGVGLFSPHSTIPSAFVALLFSVYLWRKTANRRQIGQYWVGIIATYALMQMGLRKYAGERISQMDIFTQLEGRKTLFDKAVGFAQISWEQLKHHLSVDFFLRHGDANLRHHSGWGGEFSWPQALLAALLPVFVYVVYKKYSTYKKQIDLFVLSIVGALGGLLAASMAGGQTHANRSLVSAPFLILGCAVIAVVLTPMFKQLPVVCLALGILFAGYYARDYFTKFPARADFYFQTDVRRAGERARATGDYEGLKAQLPDLIRKYGLLADVGIVYYEAAGSGKGCPGYKS